MTDITFRSTMTVDLIRSMAADDFVVQAARVSTRGSHVPMEAADNGLIGMLARDRHGSPFEHSVFTYYVRAPLFVVREFERHRIASYSEESGRYKTMEAEFYRPAPDRALVQTGKVGAYLFEDGDQLQREVTRENITLNSEESYARYEKLLESGIAREVARMVLPLNLFTSFWVTINARSLMNFLSLRVKDPTSAYPSFPQREIEMVAEQMEAHFAEKMPVTHAAFLKAGRVAP